MQNGGLSPDFVCSCIIGGMKLNLLRCLVAVCDGGLRVSAAAAELGMMQPSVSKNLMDLEKRLGAPLFVRRGKRLTGMTPLCAAVVAEARDILLKCDNIAALGRRHVGDTGDIRIGTTHLQARHLLPEALRQYRREFSSANIQIFQGAPSDLVKMLEKNQADLVICTEVLEHHPQLCVEDAYVWNRCAAMPPSHPLAKKKLTLKSLAAHPLITYTPGFTGRSATDLAFRKAGVAADVAVAAADSDVIKTYVRAGLGVGIIAAIACEPRRGGDLLFRSAAHLFPDMRVRMAHHRNKMAGDSMRRFMGLFRRCAAAKKAALGAKDSAAS